jgi:hypothetical protein
LIKLVVIITPIFVLPSLAFAGENSCLDNLQILSTQKLSGNNVQVAVNYLYEPGHNAMRVVAINCNAKALAGQHGRDMSPGLISTIASNIC